MVEGRQEREAPWLRGIAISSRPRLVPWNQIRSHGELPLAWISSLRTYTDSESSSAPVSLQAAVETHCHQPRRAVAPWLHSLEPSAVLVAIDLVPVIFRARATCLCSNPNPSRSCHVVISVPRIGTSSSAASPTSFKRGEKGKRGPKGPHRPRDDRKRGFPSTTLGEWGQVRGRRLRRRGRKYLGMRFLCYSFRSCHSVPPRRLSYRCCHGRGCCSCRSFCGRPSRTADGPVPRKSEGVECLVPTCSCRGFCCRPFLLPWAGRSATMTRRASNMIEGLGRGRGGLKAQAFGSGLNGGVCPPPISAPSQTARQQLPRTLEVQQSKITPEHENDARAANACVKDE